MNCSDDVDVAASMEGRRVEEVAGMACRVVEGVGMAVKVIVDFVWQFLEQY